jgi:hypothetical protein
VQVTGGVVTTAVIEADATRNLRVRNPWPGQPVDIIAGNGTLAVKGDSHPVLTFHATAGIRYVLERADSPVSAMRFAPVSGMPAHAAKRLGRVQIGIFGEER